MSGPSHAPGAPTPRGWVWLSPVATATRGDGRIRLEAPPRRVELTDLGPAFDDLLAHLDGDHHEDELARHPLGPLLLPVLDRHRLLVRLSRPLRDVIADRPDRTRQLSWLAQLTRHHPDRAFDRLARARVLVCGLGGIGQHATLVLAGSGVRRFVLVDPDVIEDHNLNRQLAWRRGDVGRYKVDVMSAVLHERFPDLEVDVDRTNHDHTGACVPDDVDLVVVAGEIGAWRERRAWCGERPSIGAGYFGARGFVGPLLDPASDPDWFGRIGGGLPREARAPIPRARAWNCSGAGNNVAIGGLLGEAAVRALAPELGGPVLRDEVLWFDFGPWQARREAR